MSNSGWLMVAICGVALFAMACGLILLDALKRVNERVKALERGIHRDNPKPSW